MKRIICITGMDGTGKSTIIKKLAAIFPSSVIANIWDLLNNPVKGIPFKSKSEIDNFLCNLTPDSRLLFLMHALKYSIDTGLSGDEKIIFANAFHYKYIATELVYGANADLAFALQKSFPEPDVTIELTLPVEQMAERKGSFSRYECGLSNKPDKASFIKFQQKVGAMWCNFDRSKWFTLDALLCPNEKLNNIMKIINAS